VRRSPPQRIQEFAARSRRRDRDHDAQTRAIRSTACGQLAGAVDDRTGIAERGAPRWPALRSYPHERRSRRLAACEPWRLLGAGALASAVALGGARPRPR